MPAYYYERRALFFVQFKNRSDQIYFWFCAKNMREAHRTARKAKRTNAAFGGQR